MTHGNILTRRILAKNKNFSQNTGVQQDGAYIRLRLDFFFFCHCVKKITTVVNRPGENPHTDQSQLLPQPHEHSFKTPKLSPSASTYFFSFSLHLEWQKKPTGAKGSCACTNNSQRRDIYDEAVTSPVSRLSFLDTRKPLTPKHQAPYSTKCQFGGATRVTGSFFFLYISYTWQQSQLARVCGCVCQQAAN